MTTRGRWLQAVLVFVVIALAGWGAATGVATTQRHYELAYQLDVVAPEACDTSGGDQCALALADPEWATALGLPVAAWATGALVVVIALAWLLALGLAWGRQRLIDGSTLSLAGVALGLLAGTGVYLVVGLAVLEVSCALCLTMHAINGVLIVALGVLLWRLRGRVLPALARVSAWGVALGAALAVYGVAWLSSHALATELGDAAGTARTTDARFDAAYQAVCEAPACPEQLLREPEGLPDRHASIVLASPSNALAVGHPTLVELVDMTCEACRAYHQRFGAALRDHIARGDVGVRLVLWSRGAQCNPRARGAGDESCAANAGLVCAARHGGTDAALHYIEWSFGATAGFYSTADRRQWLARQVDDTAARCLDAELDLGQRGTLARHAEWAARVSHEAGCEDWHCFASTPSFAVFRPDAPPSLVRGAELDDASSALRQRYLDACLAP